MKSFIQYISEESNSDFIFAFDANKDGYFSKTGDHEKAFPELYFGKESQRIPTSQDSYASAWGRVENGVVSLTTQHGRTPLAEYQHINGLRLTKDAVDDTYHRIHAIHELTKKYPDIKIHVGPGTYHTPTEHLKYLTGFIS